jgi:hypothetical protein
MVLRRRADHRRPADVDVLDRVLERAVRLRHRRFERIEVHHHEIDRTDLVRLHLLAVLRVVAPRQQAAVNLRVQCLHAPVENFRRAGEVAHRHHWNAGRVAPTRAAGGRSTPRACGPRANSTSPVLSLTLINARAIAAMLHLCCLQPNGPQVVKEGCGDYVFAMQVTLNGEDRLLRRLPARVIGVGFRPEHVRTPDVSR